MRISVNADDFGISEAVSQTIADFIYKGHCDTTTVMVNMPGIKKTHRIAQDNGLVHKVGLHLNLTEGQPITQKLADCTTFCCGGTLGQYKKHRFQRFILNSAQTGIVKDELRAQIERYLELGYTGMTMDSHQGIHMDWSIYPIVIELFKEYGFKRLRRSPDLKADFKRKLLRVPFDVAVKSKKITTFDSLGNFKDFRSSLVALQKSDRSVEIMCHPKVIDGMAYIDWCSGLRLDDYSQELKVCSKYRI